jgi:hypothetical protein
VILLKRGLEEYSHTEAGASSRSTAARSTNRRCTCAAHDAAAVPPDLRRRDHAASCARTASRA